MVIFYVIRQHYTKDSFPILLGPLWLRMANTIMKQGGTKPLITYGLTENQAKVHIGSTVNIEVE